MDPQTFELVKKIFIITAAIGLSISGVLIIMKSIHYYFVKYGWRMICIDFCIEWNKRVEDESEKIAPWEIWGTPNLFSALTRFWDFSVYRTVNIDPENYLNILDGYNAIKKLKEAELNKTNDVSKTNS